MTQDEKIKMLENELAQLNEQDLGTGKSPKKDSDSLFNMRLFKKTHEKEPKQSVAPWLAKNVASGASSVADLPVFAANLIRKGLGKEQVSYPSQMVKEGIESYFPSTKAQTEFQKKAEPYIEGLAGLLPWNVAGKAKVAGKFAEKIGEYSLPNIAGTLGSIYGAKTLSETNPDSMAAPLVGAVLGSSAARGATSGLTSLAKSPAKAYHWFTESNPKAAIRDVQIGDEFIRDIPYSLGANEIMTKTHQGAGKHVQKGLNKFLEKQSKYWSAETEKIKEPLLKNPQLNAVNISEPLEWSISKLKAVKDPVLKKHFMESPLGRETLEILELPKSTSASKLLKTIEKNPDLLNKTMNFDDAWAYRKSIDNTISKKGWAGLGSQDEKELTKFRHHIDSTLGKTFESISPEAYSNWKDYKSRYDAYLNREKKPALEILSNKHHPTKIYELAKSGVGSLDSHAELTLRKLKGADKKDFAESLIRDMGKKDGSFDLPTFYKNFNNIESPVFQKLLLNSLPLNVSKGLQEQLKIYKGFENIRSQPKGLFSTLVYNQPALSVAKQIKKVIKRQTASKYYQTPIGRERLVKAALKSAEHEPVMLPKEKSIYLPQQALGAISGHTLSKGDKNILENERFQELLQEAKSLGIDTSNISD